MFSACSFRRFALLDCPHLYSTAELIVSHSHSLHAHHPIAISTSITTS